MAFGTGASLASLEQLRAALAADTAVEVGQAVPDDWQVVDGVLRHARAPFFEVGGFITPEGAEAILMLQPETAIAGLLVARVGDMRYLLLNARCEPGLHGLCQYSTTIQSTPSNYLRRHGGAATPLIELFLDSGSQARVLHDSMQYDWGSYYQGKRKRFLLLEVDELLAVEQPLVWVAEPLLRQLMEKDFSVTSDLRSAVALLDAAGPGPLVQAPGRPGPGARPVPLRELANWVVDDLGIRERVARQGLAVEYVRTSSPSREVPQWTQPLLRVAKPERVRLWARGAGSSLQVAVIQRSQVGLGGAPLYFPAERDGAGEVERRVSTSAEGGRFLLHRVDLELIRLPGGQHIDSAIWLGIDELSALLRSPETTAVELRLAASMLGAA